MNGQVCFASGIAALLLASVWCAPAAGALITAEFDLTGSLAPGLDPGGLSARAVFSLDPGSPMELGIELTNTSTGVPAGFDNGDQLLTAISFDFGGPGEAAGDPQILSGSVAIGPGGRSVNFDSVDEQLGPGADVSGEWGYGNGGGSGLLANMVSSSSSGTTAFGGENLDGPKSLDGPQGGICTDPPLVAIGGLGAVADTVVITLVLDSPLADLGFLADNGVLAEFGSDAAFLIPPSDPVPEPVLLPLLAAGAPAGFGRRRRHHLGASRRRPSGG